VPPAELAELAARGHGAVEELYLAHVGERESA
jgi:hypothetical protein